MRLLAFIPLFADIPSDRHWRFALPVCLEDFQASVQRAGRSLWCRHQAIYVYFFYYAGALMTKPFYIVGILWTFNALLRLAKSSPKLPQSCVGGDRVEFGLAIGLTILLRQMFILFLPFLFIWLWWSWAKPLTDHPENSAPVSSEKQDGKRSLLVGLVLTSSLVLLLILPWTLRNYRAFGSFVPLNTKCWLRLLLGKSSDLWHSFSWDSPFWWSFILRPDPTRVALTQRS